MTLSTRTERKAAWNALLEAARPGIPQAEWETAWEVAKTALGLTDAQLDDALTAEWGC